MSDQGISDLHISWFNGDALFGAANKPEW